MFRIWSKIKKIDKRYNQIYFPETSTLFKIDNKFLEGRFTTDSNETTTQSQHMRNCLKVGNTQMAFISEDIYETSIPLRFIERDIIKRVHKMIKKERKWQ